MRYVFKPAAKSFPNSLIQKTIDVEVSTSTADEEGAIALHVAVNGNVLSPETICHAVAFAIKQRLANSIVNAATAKNDAGGLLPQNERESLWQGAFDKVLGKITDPAAKPDWRSVFGETRSAESVDPFTAEVNRIAAAGLKAWAKVKGKTLPKVGTDEYKALLAKYLAVKRADIEAEARRRLAEVEAIDFDLDDEDLPTE